MEDSRDEELGGDGLTKKIGKIRSGSPVSGAVLYKKEVLAVLLRQIATSSPPDVPFSSQDVREETKHLFGTLHGQNTQRKVWEKVIASRSSEEGWSV